MENKSAAPVAQVLAPAVSEIRSLLEASRKNIAQQVNQELLSTYWKIGEVVFVVNKMTASVLHMVKRLIAAFQGVDKGAWQGLFALECLQYAAVLFSAIQFSRQCLN